MITVISNLLRGCKRCGMTVFSALFGAHVYDQLWTRFL
jgi:hypothetical protein